AIGERGIYWTHASTIRHSQHRMGGPAALRPFRRVRPDAQDRGRRQDKDGSARPDSAATAREGLNDQCSEKSSDLIAEGKRVRAAESASPPVAAGERTSPYIRDAPNSDSRSAKKSFRGGARSGRRAADQPHLRSQTHARTVRIGRKRLVNRG